MRVGGASGAGFSLWILVLAMTKPHRLKPAPLNPRAKKMAGGLPIPANHAFHSVCERKRLLHPLREIPVLHRERTAAAATACGLRVLEHEAAAHQVFLIIQRGVIQVKEALRVHEQPRAVFFDYFVAVARL